MYENLSKKHRCCSQLRWYKNSQGKLCCATWWKKQPAEKKPKQRKHEMLQHPSKEPAKIQQKMNYKSKRKEAKTLPRHSKQWKTEVLPCRIAKAKTLEKHSNLSSPFIERRQYREIFEKDNIFTDGYIYMYVYLSSAPLEAVHLNSTSSLLRSLKGVTFANFLISLSLHFI